MAKQKKSSKITYQELVKKKVPYVLIPGILAALAMGWSASTIKDSNTYTDMKELFPVSGNVQKVQDGDTFELESGHRVRLIGINAPDRGSNNFIEGTNALKQLIQDKKVYLEYDRYQDDKYGRLLAWVWINCESTPTFLPPDYMHESNNTSKPGLLENPKGCKKGILVNEAITKNPHIRFETYKERGELKYQSRILQDS